MNIKLIIIDIDGTLLTDQNKLLERTKNTIIKAQEDGVKVILASSRAVPEVIKYAKILKIDEYAKFIICFNGCVIYDLQTSSYIWNISLNHEDTRYIYDVIKRHNLNFIAYGLKKIAYISKKDMGINRLMKLNPTYEFKLITKKQQLVPCYQVVLNASGWDDDIFEEFRFEIETNRRLQITSSSISRQTYYDVMLAHVNKAKAVKFLANHWKIKMKDCLAIGDSLSDYELMKLVKYGIMMKNGDSGLIKVIYDICESTNNDDGVGKTINKYLYNVKKIKRNRKYEI